MTERLLYTFFRSSAAFRVRLALGLKGLPWEAAYVSLPKMEQRSDAFLAMNPQGLVPVLKDGTQVLTQSLAILEYLEEAYPEPSLLPSEAAERAYVRGFALAIACDIHPLNNVRVLKYLQGRWGFDEAQRDEWYRHWIATGLGALETMLAQDGKRGRFCYGSSPGLADICLVPQVYNAERFNCPLDAYPNIREIYATCLDLDWVEAAHPKNQSDRF